MANAFNGMNNQWEVDTAASTIVQEGNLRVKSVAWVGATSGHSCVIKGANGKVLLSMTAPATNAEMFRLVEDWWEDGFAVTTLGSGKVYVNLN